MATLTENIVALATAIAEDVTLLASSKVDQVPGLGLSTEDYSTAEKTKLAALAPAWHAGLRSGRYYGGPATTIGSTAVVADIMYWQAVLVPVDTTIVELGCSVTATGTATLARLGLYRYAAGELIPIELPAEFAVTSTGAKPQTVAVDVEPGMYFLAVLLNGTASIATLPVAGPSGPAGVIGAAHGYNSATEGGSANVGLTTSRAYGALPSSPIPLTDAVYGGIIVPHLWYRV
jgi:hypothetical protein